MGLYYRVSHGQSKNTLYAPTILNREDAFLSNCPKCGRVRFNDSNRKLSLLIEGDGAMPDLLHCGHFPLTIVSERVLSAWEGARLSGFESYPVNLFFEGGKEISHPQYYYIVITGRAELDFQKMGVEITGTCDVCGVVDYDRPTWEFGEAIMKDESYDGSDLFVFKYFESSVTCSIKVLETVYRKRLTNFRFSEFESRFECFAQKPDIKLKELFTKESIR